MTLAYLEEGWETLMCPDMSYLFWGCVITHTSPKDFVSNNAVENMHHEPLVVLIGQFKGAEFGWLALIKEGYTIVNDFKRRKWVFYRGGRVLSEK